MAIFFIQIYSRGNFQINRKRLCTFFIYWGNIGENILSITAIFLCICKFLLRDETKIKNNERSFLVEFWLLFRYMGMSILVTNQQKCNFSIYFRLLFGFVFIGMWNWKSWNFRIRCVYQKAEVCTQTINEWRI